MRSRQLSFILSVFILTACSSNRLFTGSEEHLSFEIHDRFESTLPGFEGTLSKPISIAIDEEGLIYVLDEGERQIVVLSPELKVIRLIANPDESPPEEWLPFGQNRSRISVGGGIVAFSGMEGSINVFATDGTYQGTFETEHQVHDLVISSDGTIITLTYDLPYPVITYNREGHVLRRLGPAFIEGGVRDDVWDPSSWGLDHFRLTVLSDGTVVLFSRTWLRFRLFDQQGEFRDYPIDPIKIFRPTDDTEEIVLMEERAANITEWPPERVNEMIRSGEYRHGEIGSVTGMYIALGVSSADENIWLFGGRRMVECDTKGRILRLLDTDLDGFWGPAIRDGLVVLYNQFNGSLAVGQIPDR